MRLLLDEQSALATFFIHLFSQLDLLLGELFDTCLDRSTLSLLHRRALLPLLSLVQPVAGTCRFLYVVYMILPRSTRIQDLEEQQKLWRDEVKRKGRAQGRKFLRNPLHCRIREMGFTNLDQSGQPMIKVMEKLGEGGFATVYKGVFEVEQCSFLGKKIIGRPVAVKMFLSASNADHGSGSNSVNFGIRLLQSMEQQRPDHPESATQCLEHTDTMGDAQFRDELHRLVSAKHPNIVTPRGYIGKRSQGDSGLVMELMDASLHDYLEMVSKGSVPPLQELDMLDLMLEIGKGMQFLHENNLLHRDLKPKNVLLRFVTDTDLGCELLEVKIADFGLTKLCEEGRESTRHTAFQGTSCYMAPEIRGDSTLAYPEKIDVFSFGTTCFNILIGNPDPKAFSKSVGGFYEAVRTGEWKEWTQGRIDEHLHYLVKLIGKCWEPDPTMRPTFAELCLLIEHAMQCHVSAASLQGALGTAAATVQATNLRWFVNCKEHHTMVYLHIISNYLQQYSIIGLRLVTECLLDFESVVAADIDDETLHLEPFNIVEKLLGMPVQVAKQILLSGLIGKEDEDDAAENAPDIYQWCASIGETLKQRREDISMSASCGVGAPNTWKSTNEVMESCLEKPDPLIFMKGLPCHILAERYFRSSFKYTGPLNVTDFDFTSDEARSELVVDTSLIPLLVLFWTQRSLGMQRYKFFPLVSN